MRLRTPAIRCDRPTVQGSPALRSRPTSAGRVPADPPAKNIWCDAKDRARPRKYLEQNTFSKCGVQVESCAPREQAGPGGRRQRVGAAPRDQTAEQSARQPPPALQPSPQLRSCSTWPTASAAAGQHTKPGCSTRAATAASSTNSPCRAAMGERSKPRNSTRAPLSSRVPQRL